MRPLRETRTEARQRKQTGSLYLAMPGAGPGTTEGAVDNAAPTALARRKVTALRQLLHHLKILVDRGE